MGEDESKHTRLRWLDAVRYAVAGVVTVLTVAVIAWAIVQSLRPEVLHLSVANGYVTVGKITSMAQPVSVNISLKLGATNLGGRATIWYDNVTVRFLYNRSLGPDITYIDVDPPDAILVGPHIESDIYLSSDSLQAPQDVDMEFVRKMFKAQEIKKAGVILEGILKTQISALDYTHGSITKYTCSPVTIGTSPPKGADDVPCSVG